MGYLFHLQHLDGLGCREEGIPACSLQLGLVGIQHLLGKAHHQHAHITASLGLLGLLCDVLGGALLTLHHFEVLRPHC